MESLSFVFLLCCFAIFGFLFNFVVAYWIYQDASRLQIPDSYVWIIIGFVAPLIGLIIYIFAIRSGYLSKNLVTNSKADEIKPVIKNAGPIERTK